ncbi:hypothetical protein SHKM778_80250 [Streptomyces sp. KM77-8]|uniref:Uncharacterized protein n=1 Tax=Streptomyces haneummycinicus TaxID=3074435 RepID=A0AAT9HVV0_9ACTN
MRALPARRIALGALCAALLAGVTGPAALAADTRPAPTAPLAQVRTADAPEHGLTPVVDLLRAVLEADDGRLPAEEARRLGDAALAALAMPADDDPATTTVSSSVTTNVSSSVTTNVTSLTEDDLTSEEAAALREVLDQLLALLRPESTTETATETDTASETATDTASETATDAASESATDAVSETATDTSATPKHPPSSTSWWPVRTLSSPSCSAPNRKRRSCPPRPAPSPPNRRGRHCSRASRCRCSPPSWRRPRRTLGRSRGTLI